MTITTYPTVINDEISVHGDVELVKAAALYADEIELVSPGASMLAAAGAVASGGHDGLLEFVLALDDTIFERLVVGRTMTFPPNWRLMLRAAVESPDLASSVGLTETVDELREMLATQADEFAQIANNMTVAAGADELLPFIEDGVLTISPLGGVVEATLHAAGANQPTDTDDQVSQWVGLIRERLNSARSSLLFDSPSEDFLRALITEGLIQDNGLGLKRAGEAAVGAGLIARLPAFPTATPSELLMLREDLRSPMLRYRTAVADLAKQLPPIPDPSYAAHIDNLWTNNVEPALADITEALEDHGLVREIARSVSLDIPQTLASAGIFLGVNSHAGLQGLASLTAGAAASASVPVVTSAVRGWRTHGDNTRAVQRRSLFYLYQVDQRIVARGRKR